jgi:ribosomal protein S18 acetylase RimI-like enzyme
MNVLDKIGIRFIYGRDFDRIVEIAADINENMDVDELYYDWFDGSGMLAIDESDYPIGVCIYNLEEDRIFLKHIFVDNNFQRAKVGTTLINRIKQKLSERRSAICIEIEESNLAGQLFFKSLGFTGKVAGNDILEFRYDRING